MGTPTQVEYLLRQINSGPSQPRGFQGLLRITLFGPHTSTPPRITLFGPHTSWTKEVSPDEPSDRQTCSSPHGSVQ